MWEVAQGHGRCLCSLEDRGDRSPRKDPRAIAHHSSMCPALCCFSDYEETISGVRTYDVLQNVSESAMNEAPEFEIYHRLQEVGPDGLTDDEMGDDWNGPFGKTNNPGWKLDKWKFSR